MRIANVRGRLAVLTADGALDVATASAGKFGPDPQTAFDDWAAFRGWAETASGDAVAFRPEDLGPPVPRPRQVFAIGLNDVRHAHESRLPVPT